MKTFKDYVNDATPSLLYHVNKITGEKIPFENMEPTPRYKLGERLNDLLVGIGRGGTKTDPNWKIEIHPA